MEIDRDEMGSERCKGNVVKSVEVRPIAGIEVGNIPEWLLVDVLIRLPVKLVFRSKLVSKEWLSVISDPYFVRMYISRASMSPRLQPWTFIYDTMRVKESKYFDYPKQEFLVDNHSSDFKHPSLYELPCTCTEQDREGTIHKIVGVSNGLVLYGPRDPPITCIYDFLICNPTTGQWIRLPRYGPGFANLIMGFLTSVENGVLACYGVVCLDVSLEESNLIRSAIFLSEIGEWKQFTVCIDQEILFGWCRTPTSLNGILHWRTAKHGIVAYDPYTKPDYLCIIALPGDRDRINSILSSFCDAHQERLRYFEVSRDLIYPHGFSRFSIWILNDYSIGDWCLQHRINSANILYDGILSNRSLSLTPISFHPFDSNIVYLGYGEIMVSYNINTRKMEAHGVSLDSDGEDPDRQGIVMWRSWLWTFLLVVPHWPIYIPPLSFGVTKD